MESGYGHGGVLGFAVFGSPAGIGGLAVAALVLPLVWILFGMALASERLWLARAILITHTLGVPLSVLRTLQYGSLAADLAKKGQMFTDYPVAMAILWGFYVFGYVFAWRSVANGLSPLSTGRTGSLPQ